MKRYSPIQIAVASFIGTPLAASVMLSSNLRTRWKGAVIPGGALLLGAGSYFLVTLLNPIESRMLDTFIFLGITAAILFINYVFIDEKTAEPAVSRSWLATFGIAVPCFALWLALALFVFN